MKLLISESPLQVIPSLAVAIGLNEAIVLQQMHYWLVNKANSNDQRSYHDGTYWVFNTYEEWQEQFPFWSARTIRRTITSLQDQGLLIIGNYNKMAIDNTKWYTVNYASEKLVDRPCGQNGQTTWPYWTDQAAKVDRPAGQVGQANNQRLSTKTTTETTTDIKQHVQSAVDEAFEHFWLNMALSKKNKAKAKQVFAKQVKDLKVEPKFFADQLIEDTKRRKNDFGFDKLHPTTYLNGKRWEDELDKPSQPKQQQAQSFDYSLDQAQRILGGH